MGPSWTAAASAPSGGAPADPPSAGDPPVLAGSFVCVSCGVAAPSLWVLVHIPGLESVSCSPMEGLQSNPTGLQGQSPCGFPVPLLDPQAGKPDVGSKPSQQWENFFGIIILRFVGHPPGRYGFDFIVIVLLLPSCHSFFFVFGHGVSFFGGSQHPPVDGYSTASCDFGTLAEGDKHMSFYSTILNWKPAGGFLTTGAPEKAQAIIK